MIGTKQGKAAFTIFYYEHPFSSKKKCFNANTSVSQKYPLLAIFSWWYDKYELCFKSIFV